MKTLLTANLSTKTATTGGNAWEPPVFTFGEAFTLALRFVQDVDGELVEPALNITATRAMIGIVDARPASGTFALQVGPGAQTAGNTTGLLQHDCTPQAVAGAINAKSAVVSAYGTATATKQDGSWVIVFGAGAAVVPVKVVNNTLWPASFGRVAAYEIDEVWRHEVRLMQAPVATTDVGARVLPDPPSVEVLQTGGSAGEFTWNSLQALTVPPDFRATYILRNGDNARTAELSVSDTAETIQAALEAVLGVGNFKVTNPRPFVANIEFIGDFEGTAATELTVQALNPPLGDLTFTVALDRAEMAIMLRRLGTVTLPLEVRIEVTDEDDVVSEIVVFTQNVTIKSPVIWPDLATIPATDFLRPLSPKDYIPFNAETVITGQQYFPAVIGDGSATGFTLDHGLGTDVVFVFVRENTSNGLQLVQGTDFEVTIVDEDSVTVTALGTAPGVGAWLAVVMSAQTVGAFAEGLEITIGQVTGLQAILDALSARITALEDLAPETPLSLTEDSTDAIKINIPAKSEKYPMRASIITNGAPVAGILLPAIHDATPTNVTALPGAAGDFAGQVYCNNQEATLVLPTIAGRKSATVGSFGFFGSDGRTWYLLTRSGTTKSYFPTEMERELFMVYVNEKMLRAGRTLSVPLQLLPQMISGNTRGHYLLVVEVGAAGEETEPATLAGNLSAITWNATALLSHKIIVGPVAIPMPFGFEIARAANGDLSAQRMLYGAWEGGAQEPASANFVVRGRLINFDTENSITAARGIISYDLAAGEALIN
jgi:hypothetical protein